MLPRPIKPSRIADAMGGNMREKRRLAKQRKVAGIFCEKCDHRDSGGNELGDCVAIAGLGSRLEFLVMSATVLIITMAMGNFVRISVWMVRRRALRAVGSRDGAQPLPATCSDCGC